MLLCVCMCVCVGVPTLMCVFVRQVVSWHSRVRMLEREVRVIDSEHSADATTTSVSTAFPSLLSLFMWPCVSTVCLRRPVPSGGSVSDAVGALVPREERAKTLALAASALDLGPPVVVSLHSLRQLRVTALREALQQVGAAVFNGPAF